MVVRSARKTGSDPQKLGALLLVLTLWAACPLMVFALAQSDQDSDPAGSTAPLSIRVAPSEVRLQGADASQQFLVMGMFPDGLERDVTSRAEFSSSKPGLIRFSDHSRVQPLSDGELVLKAEVAGQTAATSIEIRGSEEKRAFSFPRDIGSLLTKQGCNNTACHGAVPGQGGFKLSTNATYPRDDYKWIVEGGKFEVLTAELEEPAKPRVNLKDPAKSLILLKATLQEPHGGGLRFGTDSPQYARILKWVQEGAPYGEEGESETVQIERLEVYPRERVLDLQGKQQILVTAHLSNGQQEDVTQQVVYESMNRSVVEVDEAGLVEARKTGETSVLIRAPGRAAAVRFGVIANPLPAYPEVPQHNFIDRHVFAKLRKFNIIPSELSNDAQFIRRICLDLTGTLPPPNRVREFLASRDPNKRDRVIEILLNSPEYEEYLFFRYGEIFRWYGGATQLGKDTQLYGEWLRQSIAINKPYDQLAVERIAAQGYDGPSRFFYQLRFIIPPAEMIAEQVRIYLARRLDCARCHNHPFEAWSQDQFWGMAAFYGRMVDLRESVMDDSLLVDDPELEDRVLHPRTKEVVHPRFLDGKVLPASERTDLRMKLARWIVSHPYFAEAFVNRVWDWFFGKGIVDPVDDFRSTNPPTHPELLKALAEEFRKNGHDVKHLMRVIVRSKTYQLSGVPNETNRGDRLNFSHALPRPLPASVMLDAISQVTEVPERFISGNRGFAAWTRAIALKPGMPSLFMKIFERNERKTLPEGKPEPALSQALHMLTGTTFTEKISREGGRVDRLVKSGAEDGEMIEELYLAALSRFPRAEEKARLLEMIGQRPRREAIESLTWALISSRQFAHNH